MWSVSPMSAAAYQSRSTGWKPSRHATAHSKGATLSAYRLPLRRKRQANRQSALLTLRVWGMLSILTRLTRDSDQALPNGYDHCLGASVGVKLTQNGGYVVFDGLLSDA